MIGKTITKRMLLCPHCEQEEFSIEHLQRGRSAGPWYCDQCGGSFDLDLLVSGEVDVTLRAERKVLTYNLLVLDPHQTPIAFIVEGMRFENPSKPESEEDIHRSAEFFYEEHSCPTNWFEPVKILVDGDDDPHGFLRFVVSKDRSEFPPDEVCGPNALDVAQREFIEAHLKAR